MDDSVIENESFMLDFEESNDEFELDFGEVANLGTSDFDKLTNRPSYNGESMTHETNIPEVVQYTDFVGTDGETDGENGLVPAPLSTDSNKFLNSDGSWKEAPATKLYNSGGNNTDGAITQKAATGLIYINSDPLSSICIGPNASGGLNTISIGSNAKARYGSLAIGNNATAGSQSMVFLYSIAIGMNSNSTSAPGSVALGANAKATRRGEVNIGDDVGAYGYNNTNYRVLGGVHDPVDAHDAATKNYVDGKVVVYTPGDGISITSGVISATTYTDNELAQLWEEES